MENNIEFKIFDSVDQIGRPGWDRFFGDIPEGYSFYKTLEESKLEEFSFHYAVLYRNQQAILIVPVFITDFNLDIAADGWIIKLTSLIRKFIPRFLILRTLFCGAPFGEQGIIGFSSDAGDKVGLIQELLGGLYEFARQKRIKFFLFKDFQEGQKRFLDRLLERGFFRLNSFPVAINELSFNSLEDYIKSLGPSTRKNIRRKIKNAYSQAKITVQIVDCVDNIIEDIYALYLNTLIQGEVKFERLTKEFFISVGRNMQPNAKFFLYYVNGKLSAFNLCFIYQDLCIDKFIGFDYDVSNRYHLYTVSWCYNVDWCLKNSIRFYKTGQTEYHVKLRMGSRLVPLYAYLRHKNKIVNEFLKILSLVLKPDNFNNAGNN
ncbi:MAG: GNAT family N-acetyltransferase [Candidatus Omnitrophota bacterium]|jgi:predicted N-acyltransferase